VRLATVARTRGRNAAPWLGSSSSPSPAWLEDGFHPQKLEEEVGRQPTQRPTPAQLSLRLSKDDEDP
jgi:hypothetical protein